MKHVTELKLALQLMVDLQPDDRGNLLAAAVMSGGRRIALPLNAN
jgi:hypothetical protein